MLTSPLAVHAFAGMTSVAWLGLGVFRLFPGVEGGDKAPKDDAEDGLGDRPEWGMWLLFADFAPGRVEDGRESGKGSERSYSSSWASSPVGLFSIYLESRCFW